MLGLLLTKPNADSYRTHLEQLLFVSAGQGQGVWAGPESLRVATVRCFVWESEMNRAAGASMTLWSTDPAWPRQSQLPGHQRACWWYPVWRGWTGETPGKGAPALALGECEGWTAQQRGCGLTSGKGGTAGCFVLGKPFGIDLVHPDVSACCCCLLLGFLCWFLCVGSLPFSCCCPLTGCSHLQSCTSSRLGACRQGYSPVLL